ncbi:MAG: hypothetical protein IPM58_10300 [Nitrospira sp.]|nr:hypothetical protein [Nitrospira sp.]
MEFIEDLSDRQRGDFEHLRKFLSYGAGKPASVRVRNHPGIEVQVTGCGSASEREFYLDLADAVIAAFDSHGIQP